MTFCYFGDLINGRKRKKRKKRANSLCSRPGLAHSVNGHGDLRPVTRIQGQAVTNLEPGLAPAGTSLFIGAIHWRHSLSLSLSLHWRNSLSHTLARCTACRGLCARNNMGICCIQGPLRAHFAPTATTSRPLRYYVPHHTHTHLLDLPPCGVDYDISATAFIDSLTRPTTK